LTSIHQLTPFAVLTLATEFSRVTVGLKAGGLAGLGWATLAVAGRAARQSPSNTVTPIDRET
jgi:hypothetical protein